ncbi:oxidoreductase, putative [Hepatocystis sp. ex Piliocolobus tephrosceles]|nr:oxidoreductase, putative [Hepatocystis sp. ex Piliocolobus tephrosceles]
MMTIKHPKISVLGAGEIGCTLAYMLCEKNLGDVVLHDFRKDLSKGRALDILHTRPLNKSGIHITGTNEITDIKDSVVVVVTVEVSEREFAEFDEVDIEKQVHTSNVKLLKEVAQAIKKHCPQAFVIVTTNPVDHMAKILQESANIPLHKICGLTGALFSTRLRHNLAEKLRVNPGDVQGFVIGSQRNKMLFLPRFCCVNGIPLSFFTKIGTITEKEIVQIVEKTKNAHLELMELLPEGSVCFAPSLAITEIIEAHLKDLKRVIVCSVMLNGQYGYKSIFAGVPVVIGRKGIEKIIELDFNAAEKELFKESIQEITEKPTNDKHEAVVDEEQEKPAN